MSLIDLTSYYDRNYKIEKKKPKKIVVWTDSTGKVHIKEE